jgi:transposase
LNPRPLPDGYDRSDAPCLFNGPITGESFTAWVEQALVQTLRPGDVVVIDNLGSHKGRAVRAAIRGAGAHLIFLPPDSPDLNPIEQVFAKLKHFLREAAERTIDTVTAALAEILNRFTPTECANYLTNAGYASTRDDPALAGGATCCPRSWAPRIGRPRSPGSAGPRIGPV